MGKQARQENRKLAEMEAIGKDLNALMNAKYMLAGIQVDPVMMMTPVGPTQGCIITFHMNDGNQHEPIVIDIIGFINLVAATSSIMSGRGVPPPHPSVSAEDQPDNSQPSNDQTPVNDPPATPDTVPESGGQSPATTPQSTANRPGGLILP